MKRSFTAAGGGLGASAPGILHNICLLFLNNLYIWVIMAIMETVKQQIDRHIDELKIDNESLKADLEYFYNISRGKSKIYIDSEKLEKLFFKADEICRTVERLDRANKILYQNRGKSSFKKSAASKINGAKGGRPPKEISAARKRINELDDKWVRGLITDEETKEQEQLYQLVRDWENKRKPK